MTGEASSGDNAIASEAQVRKEAVEDVEQTVKQQANTIEQLKCAEIYVSNGIQEEPKRTMGGFT